MGMTLASRRGGASCVRSRSAKIHPPSRSGSKPHHQGAINTVAAPAGGLSYHLAQITGLRAGRHVSGRVGVPPADSRVSRESPNVARPSQRTTPSPDEHRRTSDRPGGTPGPAGGTPTLPDARLSPCCASCKFQEMVSEASGRACQRGASGKLPEHRSDAPALAPCDRHEKGARP